MRDFNSTNSNTRRSEFTFGAREKRDVADSMSARQEHGFSFEKKVISSRGLIPLKCGAAMDAQDHNGRFFSCKTTRSTSVCFGDALRVLNYPKNMHSFTVILGVSRKEIVELQFNGENFSNLFGEINCDSLRDTVSRFCDRQFLDSQTGASTIQENFWYFHIKS
jgi:hypothetical protein